LINKGNL